MESSPNLNDSDQLGNDNQPQINLIYNGLYEDRVPQDWIFENEFHLKLGSPNVNHLPSTPESEPVSGSSQSSQITDFASSQSSSHIALADAEHDYSDSIWPGNETTGTSGWFSASDAIPASENFHPEIQTSAFVPPQNVCPPPASALTFHAMCKDHGRDLVYVSQQSFEPSLTGGIGEDLFNSICLSAIHPQQIDQASPSRLQSRTKPKLRELKFYCEIRPCNHQKAFKRKSDLKRHLITQRSEHCMTEKDLSQCPWPDCERKGENGFHRRDKMLQHQDKAHGWRI